MVTRRLPVTIELGILAVLLGAAIALPVAVISAVRPGSKLDILGTLFAMGGVAMPSFWLGILLIFLLSLWLRLLPPSGYVSPLDDFGANFKMMIMPCVAMGTSLAAVIMRQARSALIEVLGEDYITTARSKGLKEQAVVGRHALKNALIPVVTVIGLQVGNILGGAVVTETIFAVPGVGRLLVDSISFRDYPVVQAAVLIMAVGVLFSSLATDLLYAYLDPKIRYR
jgi:peptide/nickel transport system permease protein